MVNLDVLADDCGFANHNACAVIDKEVFADGCTRMDVDARFGMGIFGHESRENRNVQKIKFMGNAENRCRHKARIRKDNFVKAPSGRIAIKSGMQIGFKTFANPRNLREKFLADAVAFNLALVRSHGTTELAIIKRDGHLLVEVVKSIFDNDREAILRVVNLVRAVPEMSGINHTDQVLQNRLNLGLVGSIIDVDVVDMLAAIVIVKNNLYGFFDFRFLDKFVHESNLLKEYYGVHFDKLSELV